MSYLLLVYPSWVCSAFQGILSLKHSSLLIPGDKYFCLARARMGEGPKHLVPLPWKSRQLQKLPLLLHFRPLSLLFLPSCPHLWPQTFLCRTEAMASSLLSWLYGHLTLAVTQGSILHRVSHLCLCSAVAILKFLMIFNKGPTYFLWTLQIM